MSNFKKLVLEIQKYAQTDLSGGGSKPAPKPAPGGGGGGYAAPTGSKGPIINMQKAMQELAETVIRDSSLDIMQKTQEIRDPKKVAPGTPKARSKKGFADFIAEQYVGTLDDDYKGVEWSTDTGKDTYSKKLPTESAIYELDVVMDTIRRIGNVKSGEFKADGFWGFRTDNALRNMAGFAYALLQLEEDFGIKTNIYRKDNWNWFINALNGYDVDPTNDKTISLPLDEQNKRAAEITRHLKAITKLYGEVRRAIFARPMYRNYIEGDHTFDELPKGVASNVTQQHIDDAISGHKSINVELPIWEGTSPGAPQSVKLFMVSLTDRERFKNFIVKTLKCPANLADQQIFPIYQQIEAQLFRMTEEAPTQTPASTTMPTGSGGGMSI
jgi:hypothetical protein